MTGAVVGLLVFFFLEPVDDERDACVGVFELLQLGSTAIGLKTKEGVVLAVEKRITSPLLVCFLVFLPFFISSIACVRDIGPFPDC